MSYRAYEDSLGVVDRFRFDDAGSTSIVSDQGHTFSGTGLGGSGNISWEQAGLVEADTEAEALDATGGTPGGDYGWCFLNNTAAMRTDYTSAFLSVGVWIKPDKSENWDDDPAGGSSDRPTIFGFRDLAVAHRVGLGWIPNGNEATDAQFFAYWYINAHRAVITDANDCVYNPSEPYHLVMTHDGVGTSYPKLYLNGALATTSTGSAPYTSNADGRCTVCSGRIGGRNAPGVYDELTLYTNELTAGEVATLYAKGLGGGTPPHLLINHGAYIMAIYGKAHTVTYVAWDTVNQAGKTGDSANHTLRWIKDGTASAPTNSASEVDATNAPGVYKLTLTATEAQAAFGTLAGKSSTADISIMPISLAFERLPDAAPGASGGLPTVDASNHVAGVQGTLDVNATQISGDSVAADNLEAMLDGDGAALTLDGGASAAGLSITNTSATLGAVNVTNSGSGGAAILVNAQNVGGIALELLATGTGGQGIVCTTNGNNINADITGDITGSVTSVNNVVTADVYSISGDSTTADNLENLLTGAGAAVTLAGGDLETLLTTIDTVVDGNATALAALNDLSAAQVATELATYDAPTNTEMAAAFTEIKGATWSSLTDTLEDIRDNVGGGGATAVEVRQEMDSNSTQLAAIKAKTDTLGAGSVTVTSPVASDLVVTVYKGDDYQNTEGRALDWTNAAGDWGDGDITGATVEFTAVNKHDPTDQLDVTGAIVAATGTQQVRVELTDTQTDTLTAGGRSYLYQIRLTLAGGNIETIVDSELSALRSLFD